MSFLENIKNKRVHVVGLAGQEGRAVFEYFLDLGIENLYAHERSSQEDFKKNFLSYSDAYTSCEAQKLLQKILKFPSKLYFQEDYLSGIKKGDVVIVPQSYRRYPENQTLLKKAKNGEITLKQAIELVFEIAPCPIIGVTGTLGKSTVASLIAHILKNSSRKVYFSGNDREDKWDLVSLSKIPKNALAVLEISNRHLIDLRQSPHIGILNNLYPHHLDEHFSFSDYVKTKKRVFSYQGKKDFAVIDFELLKKDLVKKEEIKGQLLTFGLINQSDAFVKKRALYLIKEGKEIKIVDLQEVPLKGRENYKNLQSAALSCLVSGVSIKKIKEGILSFKGLRFRQEYLGEFSGRKIYNDGKSTDPIATIAALHSISQISLLLLGGVREGYRKGDFRNLAQEIVKAKVAKIVIFGKSANDLKKELEQKISKEKVFKVKNLETAVSLAFKLSRKGDIVVFSPACQSFDEFQDYRQRAYRFEELVKTHSVLETKKERR